MHIINLIAIYFVVFLLAGGLCPGTWRGVSSILVRRDVLLQAFFSHRVYVAFHVVHRPGSRIHGPGRGPQSGTF